VAEEGFGGEDWEDHCCWLGLFVLNRAMFGSGGDSGLVWLLLLVLLLEAAQWI